MSDATQTPARRPLFATLFVDHPASVNESYLGHFRFALSMGFWLIVAGVAAIVHALVPGLCKTTASTILARLTKRMQDRH